MECTHDGVVLVVPCHRVGKSAPTERVLVHASGLLVLVMRFMHLRTESN